MLIKRIFRNLLRGIGLWPYLKHYKREYFPSEDQALENLFLAERVNFYKQFINHGDLCFDVGANIGNRTDVFLQLGARVIVIEPQEECAKLLKLRFGNKIKLIQEALGGQSGDGIMYVSETSEVSSLSKSWIESVSKSRFKNIQWNKREKVQITTLDSVIEQHGLPEFCKIDVEGFEEEVLAGLSRPIKVVSFEYTIPERLLNIANCLKLLNRLGSYKCNYTIGESMRLESTDWLSSEDLLNHFNEPTRVLFGDVYVRFQA